jgi:transforming growth factor-beta-induced protein
LTIYHLKISLKFAELISANNSLLLIMFISTIKKIYISSIAISALTLSVIAPQAFASTGDIVDIASKAPQFSTLVTALKAADLVTALQDVGPFTVVAPNNDAFKALPAGVLEKLLLPVNKPELQKILKYHVVSGSAKASDLITVAQSTTPTVKTLEGSNINLSVIATDLVLNNTSKVIATDIVATNGIVHEINQVLIPPTFDPTKLKSEVKLVNIVKTAVANPDFSTLVKALKAACIDEKLIQKGPFTVLAPNNAAFAKIPADVLEKLLLHENKHVLAKILNYHIISGSFDASQIGKLTTAKTNSGSSINITNNNNMLTINGNTKVIATDINSSNGIIHVIDSVLIPSDVDLTKLASKIVKQPVKPNNYNESLAYLKKLIFKLFGITI